MSKHFEGIIDVLKKLHEDYKLVLVSSAHLEEVEQKLKKFGIYNLFHSVIGRVINAGRFKKTESIKKIIRDMRIDEDEVVSIGDRNVDFIAGSKAGLHNIILVDYGWGYDLSLIPDYKKKVSVKEPIDLLDAIKSYNN